MRCILGGVGLVLAAVTAQSASAQGVATFYTGKDLLERCDRDKGWCEGYILGVADGVASHVTYSKSELIYCLPSNITSDRVIAIAIARLRARPDQLQYDAPSSVLLALHEKYPCPK